MIARHPTFGAAELLVVDGFEPDVAGHVACCADLGFAPVGPFYPGPRAAAPPPVVAALLRRADPWLRARFGGAGRYRVGGAWYSLVTTPPAALVLPQRVPHYDGVEGDALAIMLYLCPPAFGGTAFYRHRATGLQAVTRADLPRYLAAVRRELAAEAPPAAFAAGPAYEALSTVAAAPGRLIAYRGNLLHGAVIPPDAPLGADPATGRLTLNIFARTA